LITNIIKFCTYEIYSIFITLFFNDNLCLFFYLKPIVNDHYGDILWKLDRKIQARYFWKNVLDFKETEDAARTKRLAAGTDIRQLRMNLLDAQSKGDLEAVTKITDQINKLQTIEASKKSATSFEAKGGLSTNDIEKITAGYGKLDAVSDGQGGYIFEGENRPIVNAGQKIFSAARTHFNKTDEPFSKTINVPDGKGGKKAVTITLSKDEVGLSKGENLNLLSQKRQTGKLKSVETEILSRIFDSFDNEGVILKKSEKENVNKKSRSKYVNVPD